MLVVIEKCEFFTRRTSFIKFIIKLGKIQIDLSYSKLVKAREYYAVKIIFRGLQLL